MNKPTLKGQLADQYMSMVGDREPWLDMGRRSSALTLPSVMPPVGRNLPRNQVVPNSNLGGRGVTTLASKVTLQMLPPNEPFFRMELKPELKKEVARAAVTNNQDVAKLAADIETELQEALVDLENRLVREIGRDNLRANAHEVFKQLLVVGNTIFVIPEDGPTTVLDLNSFVVQRDPSGTVLYAIICEEVAEVTLTEEQEDAVGLEPMESYKTSPLPHTGGTMGPEKTVKVYTGVELVGKNEIAVWQEIDNTEVEGTYDTFKVDECPYMVLRWTETPGENYGYSYVSEYEGDLLSLDYLSKAIKEAAIISARVIGGVRPSAPPGLEKKLSTSKNGQFHRFEPDDVFFAHVDKLSDLRIAAEAAQRLEQRLAQAFLLVQPRDAERVTAEEIRQQYAELQQTLGGSFAQLANVFQAPLLNRLMKRLKFRGGLVGIESALEETEPIIITGVDAIGRNTEMNNLAVWGGFLQQMIPQEFPRIVNPTELAMRAANATSVNTKNLINDPEDVAQAEQQQALQEAGMKAAGPAAGAAVKGMMDQETEARMSKEVEIEATGEIVDNDGHVNASLTHDPAADIAKNQEEAEEAPVLPDGVTEDALQALRDAGFEISAPTAALDEEAEQEEIPEDLEITPDEAATFETFAKYSEEFTKEGKLSEESREAIKEKHKIDDAVLDTILNGINASKNVSAVEALASAGLTYDDFKKASSWSKANETEAEITARNASLQSPDANIRKQALQALAAAAGLKGEAKHTRGQRNVTKPKSFDEVLGEAMRNPLWNAQNAAGDVFRAKVNAALEKSL